jgi:hypothetical protein
VITLAHHFGDGADDDPFVISSRLDSFCDASRKISPTAAAPSESHSTTRQRREFGHRELRNKFRFWEFGYVCNAKVNPASKTARQLLCEPVESFFDLISHLRALSVQRRELDPDSRNRHDQSLPSP